MLQNSMCSERKPFLLLFPRRPLQHFVLQMPQLGPNAPALDLLPSSFNPLKMQKAPFQQECGSRARWSCLGRRPITDHCMLSLKCTGGSLPTHLHFVCRILGVHYQVTSQTTCNKSSPGLGCHKPVHTTLKSECKSCCKMWSRSADCGVPPCDKKAMHSVTHSGLTPMPWALS